MDVTLVLVRENGALSALKMRKPRLLVGRKPDAELRIPVPEVSREHCEIVLEGPRLLVRDLGSSNGTYVDGQRVQEAPLAAGSVLSVGPATFMVQIDGKPAPVNAEDVLKRRAQHAKESSAAPAVAARPASPAGSTPPHTPPAKPKPAAAPAPKPAPKKASDDSDFDFDLGKDADDTSAGNIDFSDLLKDEDDQQPKL